MESERKETKLMNITILRINSISNNDIIIIILYNLRNALALRFYFYDAKQIYCDIPP